VKVANGAMMTGLLKRNYLQLSPLPLRYRMVVEHLYTVYYRQQGKQAPGKTSFEDDISLVRHAAKI